MSKFPYNTSRWQKLRRAKLMRDPLCSHCQALGRVVIGKIVDHVKAIRNGGNPYPPLDGLQTLCQNCHNRKTQSDMQDTEHVVHGFDVNGNPVDQTHEWHNGGACNHEEQPALRPTPPISLYLVLDKDDDEEGVSWV